MRFFADANYDFIGYKRWALMVTGFFTVPGLLLTLVFGIPLGIEFTGGTLIQVEMEEARDIGDVRGALQTAGITSAEIQTFGSQRAYVIRARLAEDATDDLTGGTQQTAEAVDAALEQVFGAGSFEIVRTEAVGPKVGSELRQKAALAILASFAVVLVFLALRFEWRFGLAAVIATIHDIVASIAFIFYMRVEVSLVVVAAILTIIGYSLNDTIIIFDRVRENLKKFKREDMFAVINRSINETLPRTVVTSGTTLAVVFALVVFAGAVIRPFGLVMMFGIIVGTFSSIYIASPVLIWIEQRRPGKDARGVRSLSPSAKPA